MKRIASVEKLTDADGVYGYAILGDGRLPKPVILRPDRIVPGGRKASYDAPMLQQIPPTFQIKYGHGSTEQQMAGELASSFMNTTRFIRPWDEEWGENFNARNAQRRHYFAALARSRRIVNKIVRETIAETTDPDILRLTRRFPWEHRYGVYRYISSSQRAAQLAETFPLLAYTLGECGVLNSEEEVAGEEARRLVEAGRRLRDVTACSDIPMSWRNVQPGAVHLVNRGVGDGIRHMPKTTRAQIIWWSLVNKARRGGGQKTFEWTCRNATKFGTDRRAAWADFANLLDWMNACDPGPTPLWRDWENADDKKHFLGRVLSPDMSLTTVRQLSDDWHYAVSMADHKSNAVFPDPWVPAGNVLGYEFVPITSPSDLFFEGRVMHNCIASYVERIVDRELYVYGVRENGKPVATLAIATSLRDGGGLTPCISQIAGPCNAPVPREMERAARRWLPRGPFVLPDRKPQPNDANPIPF